MVEVLMENPQNRLLHSGCFSQKIHETIILHSGCFLGKPKKPCIMYTFIYLLIFIVLTKNMFNYGEPSKS